MSHELDELWRPALSGWKEEHLRWIPIAVDVWSRSREHAEERMSAHDDRIVASLATIGIAIVGGSIPELDDDARGGHADDEPLDDYRLSSGAGYYTHVGFSEITLDRFCRSFWEQIPHGDHDDSFLPFANLSTFDIEQSRVLTEVWMDIQQIGTAEDPGTHVDEIGRAVLTVIGLCCRSAFGGEADGFYYGILDRIGANPMWLSDWQAIRTPLLTWADWLEERGRIVQAGALRWVDGFYNGRIS